MLYRFNDKLETIELLSSYVRSYPATSVIVESNQMLTSVTMRDFAFAGPFDPHMHVLQNPRLQSLAIRGVSGLAKLRIDGAVSLQSLDTAPFGTNVKDLRVTQNNLRGPALALASDWSRFAVCLLQTNNTAETNCLEGCDDLLTIAPHCRCDNLSADAIANRCALPSTTTTASSTSSAATMMTSTTITTKYSSLTEKSFSEIQRMRQQQQHSTTTNKAETETQSDTTVPTSSATMSIVVNAIDQTANDNSVIVAALVVGGVLVALCIFAGVIVFVMHSTNSPSADTESAAAALSVPVPSTSAYSCVSAVVVADDYSLLQQFNDNNQTAHTKAEESSIVIDRNKDQYGPISQPQLYDNISIEDIQKRNHYHYVQGQQL